MRALGSPVPLEKMYVRYLSKEGGENALRKYLSMADSYNDGPIIWVCEVSYREVHGSMLFHLEQLQADGYITALWEDYTAHEGKPALQLRQISRTVSGHALFNKLKDRTPFSMIRKRLIDLTWIVVTTIVTTLIVLTIKGV